MPGQHNPQSERRPPSAGITVDRIARGAKRMSTNRCNVGSSYVGRRSQVQAAPEDMADRAKGPVAESNSANADLPLRLERPRWTQQIERTDPCSKIALGGTAAPAPQRKPGKSCRSPQQKAGQHRLQPTQHTGRLKPAAQPDGTSSLSKLSEVRCAAKRLPRARQNAGLPRLADERD